MTVVYATGVKVTNGAGRTWNMGDTNSPDTLRVRLGGDGDPFVRFSLDLLEREGRDDVTPAPPAPPPGRTERETVFRVVVAVEKALALLPDGNAQVAGFLQAKGCVGDTTAEHNALAVYLAQTAGESVAASEPMLVRWLPEVTIWVECNGTIIESPAYQVALEPQQWQDIFMHRLRAGSFPALVK